MVERARALSLRGPDQAPLPVIPLQSFQRRLAHDDIALEYFEGGPKDQTILLSITPRDCRWYYLAARANLEAVEDKFVTALDQHQAQETIDATLADISNRVLPAGLSKFIRAEGIR